MGSRVSVQGIPIVLSEIRSWRTRIPSSGRVFVYWQIAAQHTNNKP